MNFNLAPAEAKPWDKLSEEPLKAYEAFMQWASSDMRLREWRDFHPGVDWPARYRWKSRRAALEAAYGERLESALAASVDERAALIAETARQALEWALESLLARRTAGEVLTAKESLQILEATSKISAMGDHTIRHRMDLSAIPEEDLETIHTIVAKAT